VDFTADELDVLLAGLFELRVTLENSPTVGARIDQLVWRLGGDPEAPRFGADLGLQR